LAEAQQSRQKICPCQTSTKPANNQIDLGQRSFQSPISTTWAGGSVQHGLSDVGHRHRFLQASRRRPINAIRLRPAGRENGTARVYGIDLA
jgi:hypothetical protein